MTPARNDILAVFADLAEEDPTVLRDLLLRVARWERPPRALAILARWDDSETVSTRQAARIGPNVREVIRIALQDGLWCVFPHTPGEQPRELSKWVLREEARAAANVWCREQGWALPEDEGALPDAGPVCTCIGPARDAHDRGCPVRLAHPRLDLGDPPL